MKKIKKLDLNFEFSQETSAGGIVLIKKSSQFYVVVIERKKLQDITLPKGHQKKNESLQETAIREVKEETGLKARPVAYLGSFTYKVKINEKLTFRTVHWFLMKAIGGKAIKANNEVKRIITKPLNFNFSFLTYPSDRKFINKARNLIKVLNL